MPIYNTRELIPFVNQLEERINMIDQELATWTNQRTKIMESMEVIESNRLQSATALTKADEALAEIGTATFGSLANRGHRLKETLNEMTELMHDIAENTPGKGGEGGFDPRINEEINSAISTVDGIIEDGLKLDYRLREIDKLARETSDLGEKDLIVPYKHEVEEITSNKVQVPYGPDFYFIEGEVTVLDQTGSPFLGADGSMLTGKIDEDGLVELSYIPFEPIRMYFPVEIKLRHLPNDVYHILVESIVQKNGQEMKDLLNVMKLQEELINDVIAMKGQNWSIDHSIMRNHHDIVKESITPKGIQVEVHDGMAHVAFSYNDHEKLSHFELEVYNEDENKFVPFDGENGIVSV